MAARGASPNLQSLVHPDAPPMLFRLPGKTLIEPVHNAYDSAEPHFDKRPRNE